MRAVYIEMFAEPPVMTEVERPAAPAGGVVVEVFATGLCRSDWHAWSGHDSDVRLPHVPGHEFAGVIAETGPGVKRWRIGDRVTAPFVEGCGRCQWCRSGAAQICPEQTQPGFTHWGSFAEYVALRGADTNLISIPESIGFEAAASLGCRFATAFHALTDRAKLRSGEWLTVVGAGGVGLSTVMIAKALGANVIAVDRNQVALQRARELGADHVLESGAGLEARIHELTTGGSHVAVDAVGTEPTAAISIRSLRRRGRHVQIGLLPATGGHGTRLPMDRVIAWELELYGTHGMAAVDYPAMLAMIERGELRPQELIERTVNLSEGAALLASLDRATPAGMTMIDPRLA